MSLPLAGVRILDLSRLLPGPYGTWLLASLGAEVIKVESPGEGDGMRTAPPFCGESSAHYVAVNGGKRSLAVDLKQPQGRQAFLRLVPTADALLESFKPGTAARLGIGYDDLRPVNPRLVYCSLSGYGQTGPLRERAGHDGNYLALAGVLGLTGSGGGPPALPAVQVADLGGGMLAALGILAGIMSARETGVGRYIDAAMFDLVFSWLGCHAIPCAEATGQTPARGGLPLTGLTPCYHVYETLDGGAMCLAALEPKFWLAFCRAAGRSDLEAAQYDPAAIPTLEALFRTRSRAAWQATLAGTEACCEPVLSLDEAMDSDLVRARGLLQPAPGDVGMRVVRSPLAEPDAAGASAAPRLGQDSAGLLAEVGYTEGEIAGLAAAGAVGI